MATAKADEMDRWLGFAVDGFGVSLHAAVKFVHGDGTRMVITMTGVWHSQEIVVQMVQWVASGIL